MSGSNFWTLLTEPITKGELAADEELALKIVVENSPTLLTANSAEATLRNLIIRFIVPLYGI
jgi:hypothetical protein